MTASTSPFFHVLAIVEKRSSIRRPSTWRAHRDSVERLHGAHCIGRHRHVGGLHLNGEDRRRRLGVAAGETSGGRPRTRRARLLAKPGQIDPAGVIGIHQADARDQ